MRTGVTGLVTTVTDLSLNKPQCNSGSFFHRKVFPVPTSVISPPLCMSRFGLWGAHQFQAEHPGEPGGGVQEQQLLQRHESRAGAHRPGEEVLLVLAGSRHHLQQLLLPPATLGSQENLPEPHADPTDVCGPGMRLCYSAGTRHWSEVRYLHGRWTYCTWNKEWQISNRANTRWTIIYFFNLPNSCELVPACSFQLLAQLFPGVLTFDLLIAKENKRIQQNVRREGFICSILPICFGGSSNFCVWTTISPL